MTSTEKTTVVERAAGLSDEVLESVEAGRRAAIEAVRKFVDTVDEVTPALVDASRRKTIVDAARLAFAGVDTGLSGGKGGVVGADSPVAGLRRPGPGQAQDGGQRSQQGARRRKPAGLARPVRLRRARVAHALP